MSGVIVGRGAVTAIGLSASASAAAQRAGIGGQAEHPFMLDRTGEPMVVALVPWGAEDMDGIARIAELALPAACEALDRVPRERRIELLLALPEPRPGLPQGYATAVVERLTRILAGHHTLSDVLFDARGHAAGLALLGRAASRVARSPEALVLVGGVDTWLVPETLEWLDGMEALHSPDMPWGFCPGEAAAFCLIAAEAGGGGRLAVAGAGEAMEENRIRTRTVCTAAGLSATWRAALAPLARQGTDGRRVDRIWCDLNSEPYRGDEIAFTVLRTREHLAEEVDIVTPADCWGDVGAATGPLLAIAAEAAAAKGYAPGPLSLLSASSEGGYRAALLLEDRADGGGR